LTCSLSEEYLLSVTEQNPPETPPYISELRKRIPHVWAKSNPPGQANHHAPIVVQLTSQAMPIPVKEHPINVEAKRDISIHIKRLREVAILVPCHLPWNTPHPTVSNPCTLLSLLTPSHQVYTILDLKDAFFSLLLAEVSQLIFAFEWTDPEEGFSDQLTWTRLPPGFKNSRTLFDKALSQDLTAFRAEHPESSTGPD
jgi:hypothetical protein